jgi:hypothetical protein
MKSRFLRCAVLALSFAALPLLFHAQTPSSDPALTAHEWGTFTSIAGKDGQAAYWLPLTGPTDLPTFVEHFQTPDFKGGLRGTVRMETPVLYFYTNHATTLSVYVSFSQGLITEWYPQARVQSSRDQRIASMTQLQTNGTIAWNSVAVSPNLSGEFPREAPWSRYYAARETSSAPLRVQTTAGEQQEKFLFYRGVSAAPLPLSAEQTADGKLVVKSLGEDEIPAIVLFERRGERIGYRLVQGPTDGGALDPPALTANLDSLCADLEGILVDQGLYPDEAHAMVETWRDSWFEEGSRLIYIVPPGFIDKVLPLTINPTPGRVVRVFVGRLEIVTPATAEAIKTALASRDEVTLNKYGRFLEPILQSVREEHAGSIHQHAGVR